MQANLGRKNDLYNYYCIYRALLSNIPDQRLDYTSPGTIPDIACFLWKISPIKANEATEKSLWAALFSIISYDKRTARKEHERVVCAYTIDKSSGYPEEF